MTDMLLVALGGAFGAVMRFWLAALVARRLGEGFPWGTLAVNASGAAAIGLLAGAFAGAGGAAGPWREASLLLTAGVLGSYTTVSSFSLQTLALAGAGQTGRAAMNVAASLLLCLGGTAAGHQAGLRLFGG